MEKYRLNDRYVRMASNYILDLIARENNIVLDDNYRRKIIRKINLAIRCIKIDDLTKKDDDIKIGAIFRACKPASCETRLSPKEDPGISFFERLILKRKSKKK